MDVWVRSYERLMRTLHKTARSSFKRILPKINASSNNSIFSINPIYPIENALFDFEYNEKCSSLKTINPKIVTSIKSKYSIPQKKLINILNFSEFSGRQIYIQCHDKIRHIDILIKAMPEPFKNGEIVFQISRPNEFNIPYHIPTHLIIDDKLSLTYFATQVVSLSKECITVKIPDKGFTYRKRHLRRFDSEGIIAHIEQGAVKLIGKLIDFNLHGLCIQLHLNATEISYEKNFMMQLMKGDKIVFSGECSPVRHVISSFDSNIIIKPIYDNSPLLPKRKLANPRVKLIPQPLIRFKHPFNKRVMQLDIDDISASGFSVILPETDSPFIVGMIIPDLSLQLGGILIPCSAKVIYWKRKNKNLKFGFYILNISLHDQRLLFDAVSKATDPHINMTGIIDMDALWENFFVSGFIYPQKYVSISAYGDELKETYRKLYAEGEDIFTHFTYEDRGNIYAHLSIIKAYEGVWMIHHLAARPMQGNKTGLRLLKYLLDYIDCLFRIPSSSSDLLYLIFYFQPQNAFMDYFFGGFYRKVNNRKVCSIDCCAYMHCTVKQDTREIPSRWSLENFTQEDLNKVEFHYLEKTGGLMLKALALSHRVQKNDHKINSNYTFEEEPRNIEEDYRKIGLMRKSSAYSLKYEGDLKAVFLIDKSDLGINMSELLNDIKVIIIDDRVSWKIIQDVINSFGRTYQKDEVTIQIFPDSYLDQNNTSYSKRYNLWVVDTHCNSKYVDVVKQIIIIKKFDFIMRQLKNTFSKLLKTIKTYS